jgi:hypothetical protein
MCGERMSCGRGDINSVGKRSCRTLIAVMVSVKSCQSHTSEAYCSPA